MADAVLALYDRLALDPFLRDYGPWLAGAAAGLLAAWWMQVVDGREERRKGFPVSPAAVVPDPQPAGTSAAGASATPAARAPVPTGGGSPIRSRPD